MADSVGGADPLSSRDPGSVADGGVDPIALAKSMGWDVAVFVHDLIPLKRPEDYPDGAAALFRRFFTGLVRADRLLTSTGFVAEDIRRLLLPLTTKRPPVDVVPLAVQFGQVRRWSSKPALGGGDQLRILTVTTWEPRKSITGLLQALARLPAGERQRIELTLVGRQDTFPAYRREVERLLAGAGPAVAAGWVGDAQLCSLWERTDIGFYPSVEEGFGLPVLESLWLARPCLCHCGSAMGEVAPGGGTMMLDMTDEAAIGRAMSGLLGECGQIVALRQEIGERRLSTWDDFAAGIDAVLSG